MKNNWGNSKLFDLTNQYGIAEEVISAASNCEAQLSETFAKINQVKEENFYKVLFGMQKNKLSDRHFNWTTGYGYNDVGRDIVESIYADVFKTEAALVRTQIVNGTHALSLGLNAILRPGDHMLAISGIPYDTIHETIGIGIKNGASLTEIGVEYSDVALKASGEINIESAIANLRGNTKLIYIQRSSGYDFRAALNIEQIEQAITALKKVNSKLIFMVDNCYGEFIETREPSEVGANLIAGSLIKNPGGGLALSGGYLAGDAAIIEQCAFKLTAPGIGKECGLTFGQNRTILQGLFMAPSVTADALKSAIFAAKLFESYGYEVTPKWHEQRGDIIQAVLLGDRAKVIAFCKAVQSVAPVDNFVSPEPWDMPGYDSEVIMAAGAFVQGSSIELSADAPMREPYAVFLQGGLNYQHGKLGAMRALQSVLDIK